MTSAGLPVRLVQLAVGLVLYGCAAGLLVRSDLGLDPWNVFHQGLAEHTGRAIGTVLIVVGALVMLAWIPLRQRPGVGTLSNIVLIGVSLNGSLELLPPGHGVGWRVAYLVVGVFLSGAATGMYIGANLGPGPRDGLMTGLARRTGRSIRLVRTGIEVTVLAAGWLLGGVVGVGTVVYALAIGPLAQIFLPLFDGSEYRHRSVVGVVVAAGEPGGEALDGGLELGMLIDERLELAGQPFERHPFLAAPLDEFLDPAIGEVHASHAIGGVRRVADADLAAHLVHDLHDHHRVV